MSPKKIQPLSGKDAVVRALEALTQMGDEDVPKVQEVFFVHRIIPMLLDTTGDVDITLWIDITGALQRPMDVVNENEEVLFRVPSPFSSFPTSTRRDKFKGIGSVVADAKSHSELHPAIGERVLRQGLAKALPPVHVDLEKARIWNGILVRYGFEPLEVFKDHPEYLGEGESPDTPLFSDEGDEL